MFFLAVAEILSCRFREVRKVDGIDAFPNLLPVFLEGINLVAKLVSEVFPHCSIPSCVFSSAGVRYVRSLAQDEISFLL